MIAVSRIGVGLFACIAFVTARADTFTFATGTNTTLATAQPVSVTPDLVIHQIPPNFTLGTAQPVSPQYMASDALGSITGGHTQEFFSTPLAAGDNIHVTVSAAIPASQFPELLLYDPNGNLVAVAAGNAMDGSSSIIDFTIPSGDAGNWTTEVAGSPNAPNPNTNFFNYDLRFSGSPIHYTTDVLGALTDPNKTGFYSISTNAGDNLHLLATTGTPASQLDELLLYDENGNLVAVAAGNGPVNSSVIDFTIPNGDAGNWIAQVAGSPNAPNPNTNLFNYDLLIQGATGTGPVNPLASPVPEPSMVTFLAGSLLSAGMIRRRLRK
jgi:hypothetical protein